MAERNSYFYINIDELKEEVGKRSWYHKIDLGEGVVTLALGKNYEVLWKNIRKVRANLDYKGKRVLDLASYDGMWAFEAEKLGAEYVVATDIAMALDNFLFCRQVLNSRVEPYYNVAPHELTNRLDIVFNPLTDDYNKKEKTSRSQYAFDIVHHLGLLYHLTDPLCTLFQSRAMLKKGGKLILKTCVINDDKNSYMVFNGWPKKNDESGRRQKDYWARIYNEPTTWWAPTILCLYELLQSTLFRVNMDTISILHQYNNIARICLIAEAIAPEDAGLAVSNELFHSYRIPGANWFHFQD